MQICDGVSTLVHSATMSDLHLDLLDWNLHHRADTDTELGGEEEQQGDTEGAEEGAAARDVLTSRSMFTIVNQTTARRGEGTLYATVKYNLHY